MRILKYGPDKQMIVSPAVLSSPHRPTMRRRVLFIALLAFLTSVTVPIQSQAPIPEALLKAKRAYIVNEAGDLKRFDSLADELRKWGRFELVDSPEKADIIIQFLSVVRGATGSVVGTTVIAARVNGAALEIRNRTDDSLLWKDTSALVGSPGRLVKNLRERIAAAEKPKAR
jgi:hypothetical protein